MAALALAGTPMFLLGALPPALIATSLADPVAVGWLAGRLSAAGTLGSLAGTLGAAFGLLPALGTRLTGLLLADPVRAGGAGRPRPATARGCAAGIAAGGRWRRGGGDR